MHRNMLIDHLAQAERHIAQGKMHVDRQRQIVEDLVRDSKDAGRSRKLLELFEDTLETHIEERDRLLTELAEGVLRWRGPLNFWKK